MSVNIEWRPDEKSGIVAEHTYLWDAAKRMGVRLPAECEGRGECDTCAVVVEEGATLLSDLTSAEREHLSPERLAAGERLACQTRVERPGILVLRPVPAPEREETTEETLKDFRKKFREMPLQKKIATLVELEKVTAFQTVNKPAPLTEQAAMAEEFVKEFREEFSQMPLDKKLTTLAELEAVAAFQTIGAIANLPFTIFEKGLDLMAARGRKLSIQDREARRPAEHRTEEVDSSQ